MCVCVCVVCIDFVESESAAPKGFNFVPSVPFKHKLKQPGGVLSCPLSAMFFETIRFVHIWSDWIPNWHSETHSEADTNIVFYLRAHVFIAGPFCSYTKKSALLLNLDNILKANYQEAPNTNTSGALRTVRQQVFTQGTRFNESSCTSQLDGKERKKVFRFRFVK